MSTLIKYKKYHDDKEQIRQFWKTELFILIVFQSKDLRKGANMNVANPNKNKTILQITRY